MTTPVQVHLEPDEARLLCHGLGEWGGPAQPTEELARAMGFDGLEAMNRERNWLASAIAAGESLSPFDWSRALAATEVAFASDVWGSGWDWENTWGQSDAETIKLLRGVQKKLRLARALGQLRSRSE